MLRMSQLLSATALSLSALSSYADFYAGAGIGSDTVDFAAYSHVFQISPGFGVGFDVLNKSHLSATGVFGTLFAGYGKPVYNNFYVAAEVNGNLSSTETKMFNREYVNLNFSDTVIKAKNSIGVSILPGYVLPTATLLYGRLGYDSTQIKEITTDVSLVNFSKRFDGFRYGLGINQAITDRVTVRMDYSRIDYESIKTSTVDVLAGVTKNTTLSPTQQLVEISLIYNFGDRTPEK